MKKHLCCLMSVVFLSLGGGIGCSSDNDDAGDLTAPTCSITAPEDGALIEMGEDLVIKGNAADEDGTIASVGLSVGGSVVSEVTQVPFEHVVLAEDLTEGPLSIVLTVTDDSGNEAKAEVSVTILGIAREFTDPRDGKVYKTVKLGTQEWFAENLAYLPTVNPGDEGSELEEKKEQPMYYVYNYFGSDVAEAKATVEYRDAGVLYNWWAVMAGAESPTDPMAVSTIQGPCPAGWHVPSTGEWWTLCQWCAAQIPDEEGIMGIDPYGTPDYSNEPRLIKNIIKRLRSVDGWNLSSNSMWLEEFPECMDLGTDEWGFDGYPSGCRYPAEGSYFCYYAKSYLTYLDFWLPYWDTYYPANPGGGMVGYGSKYELSFNRGSDPARGYSVRCVRN